MGKPNFFFVANAELPYTEDKDFMTTLKASIEKMGFEFVMIEPHSPEDIGKELEKYKGSEGMAYLFMHGEYEKGATFTNIDEKHFQTCDVLDQFKNNNIDTSFYSLSCMNGGYLEYASEHFGGRTHAASDSSFELADKKAQDEILHDIAEHPEKYASLGDPKSEHYLDSAYIIEQNIHRFNNIETPNTVGKRDANHKDSDPIYFNYEKALVSLIERSDKKELLNDPQFADLFKDEAYKKVRERIIEADGNIDFCDGDLQKGLALNVAAKIMKAKEGPYNESEVQREKTTELYDHICHADKIDYELVKTLIKEGADVKTYSSEMLTGAQLTRAFEKGADSLKFDHELTRILLDNGANPNSVCGDIHDDAYMNISPLKGAIMTKDQALFDMLTEAGGKMKLDNPVLKEFAKHHDGIKFPEAPKAPDNRTNYDILKDLEPQHLKALKMILTEESYAYNATLPNSLEKDDLYKG